MIFHIISLFPEIFKSYFNASILKRAIEEEKISLHLYNPRDYADDKWQNVDDKPYGGGPGMVIKPLPVIQAVEEALSNVRSSKLKIIWLTPSGKQFTNKYGRVLARRYNHLVFICGRYEGVDQRVRKIFRAEEVSIGPYVLTGGELPAMILVDVIARHINGVLGDESSVEEERIASSEVYTRPEVINYKGKVYRVPGILLTGHHRKIEEWRRKHSRRTVRLSSSGKRDT